MLFLTSQETTHRAFSCISGFLVSSIFRILLFFLTIKCGAPQAFSRLHISRCICTSPATDLYPSAYLSSELQSDLCIYLPACHLCAGATYHSNLSRSKAAKIISPLFPSCVPFPNKCSLMNLAYLSRSTSVLFPPCPPWLHML
jgi:hypothetical protein